MTPSAVAGGVDDLTYPSTSCLLHPPISFPSIFLTHHSVQQVNKMAHSHAHESGISHSHDDFGGHGHSHDILDGPGSYLNREMPLIEGRDWKDRAFTIGIGG